MIASNTTREALYTALDHANAGDPDNPDHNIAFNELPTPLNKRGDRFRFTLTVINTRGSYGKRNPMSGRRVHALCWHGHARYFRSLFAVSPNAEVQTARSGEIRYGADSAFNDWQEGPMIAPYRASEACECNGAW